MLSREVIFEQILKLGVKNADLIFIAADLRRVGFFNKTRAETEEDWIYVFNSLLALEITIVIPSYTPTFLYFPPFFKGKSNSYFSSEISGTNSGSLSELILRNKSIFNFIRSDHPTNSLISIGPLVAHDELGADGELNMMMIMMLLLLMMMMIIMVMIIVNCMMITIMVL